MDMIHTCSVERLNSFLETVSTRIDEGLRRQVVMGNESADLDSVVSALLYAYYLHHRSTEENICVLPLINMPSNRFRLKPEIAYWLDEAGVDIRHLIFLDDVDLNDWSAQGHLRVTLVDHNVLSPSQSYLRDAVVEVIDHHFAEDQPFPRLERLVIEPVGSTATLVAECILDTMPELIDDSLAKFLIGPILLDTVNLDRSKGRCQDKDILIALRLLTITPLARDEVFVELMTKKADLSGLSAEELLLRDVKTWSFKDFRLGISVIPTKLRPWLEKNPKVLSKIAQYRRDMQLDLYLIMAYSHTPIFSREIIGHAADRKFLSRLFTNLMDPLLDLDPLNDVPLSLEDRLRFFICTQNNTLMSRKKLVPFLKRYLEKVTGTRS